MNSIITPFVVASFITHKWWSFIITFVPVFGMYSVNLVATELEMPFGNDANDLPLDDFQEDMNKSLLMLMHTQSDWMPRTSNSCIMEFEELQKAVCKVDINTVSSCNTRLTFNGRDNLLR